MKETVSIKDCSVTFISTQLKLYLLASNLQKGKPKEQVPYATTVSLADLSSSFLDTVSQCQTVK